MRDIIQEIQAFPDYIGAAGCDIKVIETAEKKLKLRFAEDYRRYLQIIGLAMFGGHELTGITTSSRLNVVNVTEREREKNSIVPAYLYVVEEANMDGIIVWQDERGQIYFSQPNCVPVLKYGSLAEYLCI